MQRSGWERACVGFAEQEVYLMWRRCEGLKVCALGGCSNQLKPLKFTQILTKSRTACQVIPGLYGSVMECPGKPPLCAHSLVLSRENPGSTYIIFWSILVSFCPFKRTNKDTGFFLGGRGVPFPAGFYGAIPGIRTGRMRGLREQIMCV